MHKKEGLKTFLLEILDCIYLDLIQLTPSAFGATALPKNAAKTIIVKTYGAICKQTFGTCEISGSCFPIIANDCDKPKNKLESIAPTGFQRPKIIAAKAMKPGPAIVVIAKLLEMD